jgi:hypothetical protein
MNDKDPIYQGWLPLTDRLCLKCGRVFQSALYQTCNVCRGELDYKADVAEELDRQEIIQWARGQ